MKVNCIKCIYYFVTWEPARPRGCKFFGFKSYIMPAQVVLNSSGKECEAFQLKK